MPSEHCRTSKLPFSKYGNKIFWCGGERPFPKTFPAESINLYCLKCDVSKCFHSINHRILLDQLKKAIADKNVLWLLKEIIGSFETGNEFDHLFPPDSPFRIDRPRGIPIGNLTSQLFVNICLDALDQFAKHILKVKYYVRYVDDFVILHPDKKYLHDLKNTLQKFLRKNLNLELHPKKQRIFPASQGIDFLGYVVFPDYCLLRKSNKEKFRKKLRKFKKLYLEKKIEKETVRASLTSWLAHANHAKTRRLRTKIFGSPLSAENQEEIEKFIDSWKNPPASEKPLREPSGQLRLF